MLYSMTGFGRAESKTDTHLIKVEIKTLNSKFLDLNTKLPRELSDKELNIKSLITSHIKRGKVSVVLEVEAAGASVNPTEINEQLFEAYYRKYEELAQSVDANPKDLFRLALHSPDVIKQEEEQITLDWSEVESVLMQAIDQCNQFRASEGGQLQEKLSSYIAEIQKGLEMVTDRDPQRTEQIRSRIGANLEEIKEKTQVDQNRFEQEIIYYIEKLDITEEKVRLKQHLDHFSEVMDDQESQGKKLGFIAQEIGREINTIGAKANDAEIQRAVVSMKDNLEKIKEQSLNIL